MRFHVERTNGSKAIRPSNNRLLPIGDGLLQLSPCGWTTCLKPVLQLFNRGILKSRLNELFAAVIAPVKAPASYAFLMESQCTDDSALSDRSSDAPSRNSVISTPDPLIERCSQAMESVEALPRRI